MTDHRADTIAVSGTHVRDVGEWPEMRLRYKHAEVVDHRECTIVPGFHDAHLHIGMTVDNLLHLDVSPRAVSSVRDLVVLLKDTAIRTPVGSWIRASGLDDSSLAEGRAPDRWDLDQAAPSHPVLVVHVANHWGICNSAALRQAGIDERVVDPPGGAYGRDGGGRLNGRLVEQALFDFAFPQLSKTGYTPVPQDTFEDRLVGLRRAVEMYHAAGITSVVDALVGTDDLRLLLAGIEQQILSVRVGMLASAEQYGAVRRIMEEEGGNRVAPELLRLLGVKTFIDGAVGGRTCLLEDPYEGTEDHGIQTRDVGTVRDVIALAHQDRLPACVHANGDRAIRILLGLLEDAFDERTAVRDRIEHCTVVTESIIQRMARMRTIAVPFASYVLYYGSRLERWYGRDRVDRMFAHRSLLDGGICVAGASDYPCGPFEPLAAMQSCVTRRGTDGREVGIGQRITPGEALHLYTTGAAEACGAAGERGRLAPEQLADFVVLADDPLDVPAHELGTIRVVATYVGGERVWPVESAA